MEKGLGFRETWTAKCTLTGEELKCGRPTDIFECRHKDKRLCPNYLKHYIKGNNCKLAIMPHERYDRFCLPSRLKPEVERLKGRSTTGLAALYKESEKSYFECDVPEIKVQLRATLGAIIVILSERDAKSIIFKNLDVKQ